MGKKVVAIANISSPKSEHESKEVETQDPLFPGKLDLEFEKKTIEVANQDEGPTSYQPVQVELLGDNENISNPEKLRALNLTELGLVAAR